MADIFISYKKTDYAKVAPIKTLLEAQGWSVWIDTRLEAGDRWDAMIERELAAARCVVVVWTEASIDSHWVRTEANEGLERNILVPVTMGAKQPLAFKLVQFADLLDWNGDAASPRAQALISGVRTVLGAVSVVQPPQQVAPVQSGNRADRRLWEEMRAENTAAAYSYYLRKFPQGAYAAEADDLIWAGLEREASAAAYQQYLDAAPQGRHSAVAEYRLERLTAEAMSKQQEKTQAEKVALWKAEGCLPVLAGLADGPHTTWWIKPGSGESFRDAEFTPELVVAPSGKFMMGSDEDEIAKLTKEHHVDYFQQEGPQHEVTIPTPFAVGKHAVTFDEWDAAIAAGGVTYKPSDAGWGRGRRPVINVSWEHAQSYVRWLSAKTGKSYRLLSESEWEYLARIGAHTPFWGKLSISTMEVNYFGNYIHNEYREKTVPVDFPPARSNTWGLHQMHGNIWEWVEDCWNDSYRAKGTALRSSGEAWTSGDCARRALRGGSWADLPRNCRAASRMRYSAHYHVSNVGFRLARTL